MKRKRIGKKQRALLTRLELLGPVDLVDLSRNDQRGALGLVRHGLAEYGRHTELPEDHEDHCVPEYVKII